MGRILIAGFEPGVVATSSGNYRYLASTAMYGTPSCVTTPTPVHGTYCGYFPASSYLRTGLGGNVVTGRFYVRLASLPASEANYGVQLRDASTNIFYFRVGADGTMRAAIGTTKAYASGPILSVNTWYRIDFRVDVSTATWTCDWQVDGSAQTQASQTEAAGTTFASVYFGSISSSSTDTYMDSIVLDDSSGVYPIGDTEVVPLLPNGNGTHSHTDGDFDYATDVTGSFSEGTTGTDFEQYVDDVGSGLDGIRQDTSRSAGYVEFTFEDLPSSGTVHGVQPVAITRAASTSACQQQLKISDDAFSSSRDVYPLTTSPGTSTAHQPLTYDDTDTQVGTKPSDGGAWTDTAVNALKARWGYSTDVSPAPYLMGLVLEVEYTPSGGGVSGTAVVSGGGVLVGAVVKGGRGSPVLAGGGAASVARIKGGFGGAALGGGGDAVLAMVRAALGDGLVAGGGSVVAGVLKGGVSGVVVPGGGVVAVGDGVKGGVGSLAVAGGGALVGAAWKAGVGSAVLSGGGAVTVVGLVVFSTEAGGAIVVVFSDGSVGWFFEDGRAGVDFAGVQTIGDFADGVAVVDYEDGAKVLGVE